MGWQTPLPLLLWQMSSEKKSSLFNEVFESLAENQINSLEQP
jgi:hypothetical protein